MALQHRLEGGVGICSVNRGRVLETGGGADTSIVTQGQGNIGYLGNMQLSITGR